MQLPEPGEVEPAPLLRAGGPLSRQTDNFITLMKTQLSLVRRQSTTTNPDPV